MILNDRIDLGGTLAAPDAKGIPAFVGHQGKTTRGDKGEVFFDQKLIVMLAPHPLAVPGNALHWDGETYTIGGDVRKRRRGASTHHLTLEITKLG